MNKLNILIVTIFLLSSCQNSIENKNKTILNNCFSSDQFFVGQVKTDDKKLINFQFKITSKDSVTIVSYQDNYYFFTESTGNIIKINDSIFYLKTKTIFSTYFMIEPLEITGIDSIDCCFDTLAFLERYKSMKLIYSDNTNEVFPIKEKYFVMPVDKNKFNEKSKTLKMDIGYINPINKEPILFCTEYGSSIGFSGLQENADFYVIIKNNILKSINFYRLFPPYYYECNLVLKKNNFNSN